MNLIKIKKFALCKTMWKRCKENIQVRQWWGKAPVGPTGGLKDVSMWVKSQCTLQRHRYLPLLGVRCCEESWSEWTRTGSRMPLLPPKPSLPRLWCSHHGGPGSSAHPDPAARETVPCPSEALAQVQALGREDDRAAIGTATVKTAGRYLQRAYYMPGTVPDAGLCQQKK